MSETSVTRPSVSVTVSGGRGPQGPSGTGGTGTVSSVNGATGAVTLTSVSVSAASAVHTHTTTDISGFTAAAAAAAPVQSVNSKTGAVLLSATDVTAANAVHVHSADDITSGTINRDRLPVATTKAIGAVQASSGLAVDGSGHLSANVRSVAGRTGDVTLTGSDVSGVVTTLNSLSGVVEIAAGSNITVSAGGTTVTIASTASGGGVTSVAGVTGSVTLTAIGLATSTSGQVITLDARPVRTTPTAITASQNDYNPGAGDIFRISSGSTNTLNITGLATAAMAQEALFINVSTHTSSTIRFQHQNTNSIAAQRIVVPWAGDLNLAPNGGSVVVVRDTTDDRWRTV